MSLLKRIHGGDGTRCGLARDCGFGGVAPPHGPGQLSRRRGSMDPVTHTMVGATLAQTGLRRRTALGVATLVIGANLPDVDMLAYFWGSETAVWFRRGLTHGVLGLIVLPFVLTGLIVLWDRYVRRRRRPHVEAAVPARVLTLAAVAVATHPLLDFLNSYGMRWLAPFSWTWFYGDTLFIIDPWVWTILAAGLWWGRRGVRGPKLALGITSAYVVSMALSNVAARSVVKRELEADGVAVERMMTAPLAVTPFVRWVVVEDSSGYRVGMFNWLARPAVELGQLPFDRDPPGDAAAMATQEPNARRLLSWTRFPYFLVLEREWGHEVHIGDARYSVDPIGSWASTRVTLRRRTQGREE
jgi:inner membrane protein